MSKQILVLCHLLIFIVVLSRFFCIGSSSFANLITNSAWIYAVLCSIVHWLKQVTVGLFDLNPFGK